MTNDTTAIIVMLASLRLQIAAATFAIMGTHKWDRKGDLLPQIKQLMELSGEVANNVLEGRETKMRTVFGRPFYPAPQDDGGPDGETDDNN